MSYPVIHVYHEWAAVIGEAVRRAAPDLELVAWTEAAQLRAGLPDLEVLFAPSPPRDGWAGASRLRVIQLLGVGVDHLLPSPDLPPQVVVTCARGVFAGEVAEYAIAAMLALCRGLPQQLADQRAHRWAQGGRATLAGERVTILGFGEIGTRVARLCLALGMRVTAVSRSGCAAPGLPEVAVVAVEHLDEALADARYLVITAPRTPATIGLIDAAMLARLPPGAHVVNVARGGIVDEDALLAALRSHRLAGAALDVFATEPLPADSPLWDAPGLLISPHVAGYGHRYIERCVDVLVDNVRRLAAGEPLVHVVDRAAGY